MRPIYIFDLDGTISLPEHRVHLIKRSAPDWTAFYAACVDDEPNWPVIRLMRSLQSSCVIHIFSGRSDEVFEETVEYLKEHKVPWNRIQMREEGDTTPDDVLKRRWLNEPLIIDRSRVAAVFDDRDKVVKMWRDEGLTCFQVAPGDF